MKKLVLVAVVAVAVATASAFKVSTVQDMKVDLAKSKINWLGKKVTGEHAGTISLSSGNLVVVDNKITSGKFEIDMNTITCTDIEDKTYNANLVGHLKADDFFAADKFPKAVFEITTTKGNAERAELTGNLTIKGITKSVTFPAELRMSENVVVAVANIQVNRTDFGIKFKSASVFSDLGDKAIDDMFTLNVQLVATK